MSNRTHNDSMSEQGNFQYVERSGTGSIRIDAGTTNVRVYGASTPVINLFKTVKRPGRKIRIWAASDTAASVVINDVSGEIIVASSTTTLAANTCAEFVCVPQASGADPIWVQTWTTGATS